MFFFAVYPATLVYIFLYHRYEVKTGFKNLINSFRKKKNAEVGQYQDVHNRLMKAYPEVPEWHYLIVLVAAIAFGVAGIAGWETYATSGVVLHGIILALVFVVPVGIIKDMTGVEVTLNVLAEFIGGSKVAGNAVSEAHFLAHTCIVKEKEEEKKKTGPPPQLAMNYFKSFGYVACAHAVWFANDLKLAHYI